ncbi:xylulokinase [Anaerococcus sp. AGMB09787]|uniref:xylulokinase n=1 Tax=Anaerococcus sp. AGMB09787 TaxID=2922869 RepID=UPI001FAEE5F7
MNFIGIDLGTSSIKVILYDEKFRIIGAQTSSYDIIEPQNGWGEQNPSDWIDALNTVLLNLKDDYPNQMKVVKSIGLTGQMHGLVMLDQNSKVLRNAILWLDQRSSDEVVEITEKLGYDYIIKTTANPISSGFTLAKLQWVRNNEKDLFDKCNKILLPKDYIRFYLTGDFATDVSDASGMQMLNIKNRCWDKDLLEKMEIPYSLLPKVYESCKVTGYLKEDIALKYGFSAKVSIVAGAGDNAAAAIGCGVIEDGDAFTTIGTSGVVFAHTSNMVIDNQGRYHTFCAAIPNEWHVMGVTQAAGLSLEWLKRNLYPNEDLEKVNKDVDEVEIGSNKLVYLPYLMGERSPHLDPYARGTLIGLTNTHSRKEISRSIFEGVSFSLRDCLDAMRETANVNIKEMALTGGGSKSKILCQMISDNFKLDTYTLKEGSGTTLGAAILASVGSRRYKDIKSAVNIAIKNDKKYMYNRGYHEEYSKYYDIYRSTYKSLKDVYKKLQEL